METSETQKPTGSVTSLAMTRAQLDMNQAVPFSLLHADDNITIVLYKPRTPDAQSPHNQDEYYFVASGSGSINIEGELTALQTGDAVFVAANAKHQFEGTSSDFSCWALFYGPQVIPSS